MKRCCESCRFFQTAGFAGSGWCRHPQRIESKSDLVLVRASSLGCRAGWAHDLWEPNTESRENQGTITIGPLRPATDGEIAAILAASEGAKSSTATPSDSNQTDSDRSDGQDLVVGTAPSPLSFRPRLVPSGESPDGPSGGGAEPTDGDPEVGDGAVPANQRASILRAREIQRARLANRIRPMVSLVDTGMADLDAESRTTTTPESVMAHTGNGAAEVPSTWRDEVIDPPDDVAEPVPVRPSLFPVPPVPLSEMRAVDHVSGSSVPVEDERFDTVPARDPDFVLPVRQRRPVARLITDEWQDDSYRVDDGHPAPAIQPEADSAPTAWSEPIGADDLDEAFDPAEDWYPQPDIESARNRPRRPGFSFRLRRSPRPDRTRPPSVDADVDALPEVELYDDVVWQDRSSSAELTDAGPGDWSSDERRVQDEWQARGWSSDPSWEPDGSLTLVERETRQSTALDFAEDVVVDDNNYRELSGPITYDALINDYVIAPELPRMCQTCRDFRPFEGGERGWCTSAWAFEHRRMVSAWEMPCESAIGSWWLPNDDVWADEYSEHHTEPTPLLDSLLASRYSAPKRRVAGRRRRR